MGDKIEEQLKKEAADAAVEEKARKDAAEKERLEALAIHRRQESKNWVKMSKGNETSDVHNTCVESHKLAGWTVVE